MASYTQRITLDVSGNYLPYYKYLKQGDGDSIYIVVTVTQDGVQVIPAEGDTALIRVQKPDNTTVLNECTVNADGTITARITQPMTEAAGLARADISIMGSSEETLSTVTFFLDIDPAPVGAIESSNEFLNLRAMLARSETLLDGYETALGLLNGIKLAAEDAESRAETAEENAEAWAVGKRSGTDVESSDPAYHNNAKYHAQQASESDEAASGHKLDAEAYAKGTRGGTPVTSGDAAYQNNAKYYSQQAALSGEGYIYGTQNGVPVQSGTYFEHNAAYYMNRMAYLVAGIGYDVDFDTETQTLYLLDADGNRTGEGIVIEIGSDGLLFNGGYQDEEGYIHLTIDGEDLDPEVFTPFQVAGGGGGGAVSAVTLSNVVKPSSVRNGEDAIYSFNASSTDDTNITVNWYVDGILKATNSDRVSGSSFSFNAGPYLKPSDTSTVKAAIVSESGATLNRQWDITSTAFSLAWGSTIHPVVLYTANENVYVPISVSAQARMQNIITVIIGNHEIERTVTGAKNITVEIDKSYFSSGVNTITATMVSAEDESDEADPISFNAIWGYGAASPIVAFANASQNASQYDIAPINFMVYDPAHETASVTLQVGTETARSLSANRTMQTLNYVPQDYGTKTVTLTCGASSTTMSLVIAQSEYNIGMITGDNLRYSLDPMGHSNTDADRDQFGGLTFSAGFDWVNGGFQNDAAGAPAFVVKKGNRVTMPRCLFEDADGNGKTVDLSFQIRNSDLYQAVAMQELNNGGSKGLILRANEGELRLNNTTGQIFRYCEDSRIDLSINVEAVNDQRVMTVWLDGIPAQANTYANGTMVQNENALVIGSDHCDVWVYAIRVYNSSLSNRDMIQNYVSLGPTTAIKIARCQENDIYDDNGVVTPATLHAARPDLTIVHISAERMTTGKKDPVDAVITIQDGSTVLTLDTNTKFQGQGTSSAAYGRAAYNLDLDFKKSGKTYALTADAIPVNYINIKVNVASSENANNICAADNYNTYQPYLIPARSNPGVRDTVQGKPCAVFFTNTSQNTIWIGSQQLRPGDTVLYAMGDICNSKKNTVVFGQDQTGEHYTKGCIEVSGNDTLAQQFKATSTYYPDADDGKGEWQTVSGGKSSLDYEWRTKPKSSDVDEVVASWNAAVAWLVSTIGDSAKFKAEVGDYFAIDSLLYHFLWMEFYSALDNVSKNTFYSYDWDEDAGKYLWNICKNYDDDTILGCDNDGFPLVDYGADFGDKAGARSVFNADENTIWVNIQDAYYTELAALYITLRGRGAWDANQVISKWDTYQEKRPHAAMAEDAYNKYILPYKTTGVTVGTEVKSYDDSYLPRLQGSKTYQRRQFLTYQAKYMDGKYGYYSTSSSIAFRANAPAGTTQDLSISVYAKTYVTVIVDNGTRVSHKIATGGTAVFQNTAVHSNATIYVTPESLITAITPIDDINNSTFAAAGATKLSEVILGSVESENTAWDANTGLNIPSVVLKELSIRNVVNFARALDLSANVELESVDTRGTNAGIITLPSYAPLDEIYLNACSGITALNLQKATVFSVASGANLTAVRVENCNSLINNAMAQLLADAVNAGGNTTRIVRMTGVNWSLADARMLYTIATKWHGFDALGQEQNTPVITGYCHITSLADVELSTLNSVFPGLTVEYDTLAVSFDVVFKNYDGTVLDTQHVIQGYGPDDPVTRDTSPIQTPARPSSEEYVYTYDGWMWPNGTTIPDVESLQITQDTIIFAHYTETVRSYTVRWYNGSTLLETQTKQYGQEAVYSGADPVSAQEGSYAQYYLFKGWDKSTGFIASDLDVYAQYDGATVPSSGSLSDWSPEQLHAMIAAGELASTGTSRIAAGDTIDIVAGNDFSFGNVDDHTLVEVGSSRTFDGTNYYKPQIDNEDILLWDEDKSWTLAIDCIFDPSCTIAGNLAACFDTNGFLIRCSAASTGAANSSAGRYSVRYGSSASLQIDAEAENKNHREMVVLRHKAGDSTLYVYASNKNGNAISYSALSQASIPSHDAPLAFGAVVAADGYVSDYGIGTIAWAKLWDADLGDSVAREIASWPRQIFRMEAVASGASESGGVTTTVFRNFKNVDTNRHVNCAFLLNTLLEQGHQMNTSNVNNGGIGAMPIHTWLNTRVLNALPKKWRTLAVTVTIKSTAGGGSSGSPSNSIADPPATGKIWLPSAYEIGVASGTPYVDETEAGPFTNFPTNASRIRSLNFGTGAVSIWWLRSPLPTSSAYFWLVYTNGSGGSSYATYACGVAFGFCI